MSSQGRHSYRTSTARLLVAMSVAFVVSCLTYYGMLTYFFTGTDTLTLIETSRIHNLQDVVRLVSEPLMSGSKFVEVGKFYRPLTAFSYSLDYAIWNLQPWGFQLTNLLLNALVASLAVLVMFELSDKDLAFACLSGIIFAIHPVLVESVPATDRRQDMLAAVFLLPALVLFIRYQRDGAKKKLLIWFSLGLYAMALAAKEIAIVTLPLVSAQAFLFSESKDLGQRVRESVRVAAPFLMVTGLFLAWRTIVLGGIGGYLGSDPRPFGETLIYCSNVLNNYVIDLIYPVDALGFQRSPFAKLWTCLMLALVAGYVWFGVWNSGRWAGCRDNISSNALVQFLLIWLALPLLIFITTLTFAHRSMYISAIPFSALIAYPAIQSYRSLMYVKSGERSLVFSGNRSALYRQSRMIVAGFSAVFFVYILAYSPLVRTYGHWRDSGSVAFEVLTQLTSELHDISQGYLIEVQNLPDRIQSYEKKIPRAKEVNYIRDYSIQSWLNMRCPNTTGTVVVRSRSWPLEFPVNLHVRLVRLSRRNLAAFVEMGAKTKPGSVAGR